MQQSEGILNNEQQRGPLHIDPEHLDQEFAIAQEFEQDLPKKPRRDAVIRCHKCHAFVRPQFTHAGGPDGKWWEGQCPNCGAKNLIRKPSWTKELNREAQLT